MNSPTDWTIGYCTNVHPGVDLASIQANLNQFALPVRIASGLESLGVGLWLPEPAVQEIGAGGDLAAGVRGLATFLNQRRLRPYTINGFPQRDFHQAVVKHSVYRPTWAETARLKYTERLAEILASLMDESESLDAGKMDAGKMDADTMDAGKMDTGTGDTGTASDSAKAIGSISTLPIGWPSQTPAGEANSPGDLATIEAAGKHFRELAGFLAKLESRTGRRIVVAVEPEPGCILDTTDDVVAFFAKELPDSEHRRHITVCHDVCHSAVMMEPQADVLAKLTAAGITIGKVQISSAVVADWQSMAIGRRREAIEQLSQFAEDRYLHQTSRLTATNQFMLSEDLPELIARCARDGDPVWGDHQWVVHFHVPIFLERFGHLTTTQDAVVDCLRALASPVSPVDFTGHLEIETYAWTVLPSAMRKRELADDIASEVAWLRRGLLETY